MFSPTTAETLCTDFLLGMGGLGRAWAALNLQRAGAGPGSPSGAGSPARRPAATAITCWSGRSPRLGPSGNDRIGQKWEPAPIPATQMREMQKQMTATWPSCRMWEPRGGGVEGNAERRGVHWKKKKNPNKPKARKNPEPLKRRSSLLFFSFRSQHSKAIRRVFLSTNTCRQGELTALLLLLLGTSDLSIEGRQRDNSGTRQKQAAFSRPAPLRPAQRSMNPSEICREFSSPVTTGLSEASYLVFGWAAMLCSRRIKRHSPLVLLFQAEKQLSNPTEKVTITNSI